MRYFLISTVILAQLLISNLIFAQKCLTFDGTDDYVRVSDNNALDLTTSGTLEAWVYPEAWRDGAGIIHKGDRNDWTDEAYSLEFSYGSNKKKIDFYLTAAGIVQNKLTSTSNLELNKWTHVVVSWNSTNLYMYINGNLEASMNRTVTPQNSTAGLNIGCQLNQSCAYYPFKGKLDEIRIWNIYKTQSEIRDKMYKELSGNESGLVIYFNFNGSGSSVSNNSNYPKSVEYITLTSGGTNYTSIPSISFSGGNGSGATASVSSMKVYSASVSSKGSGYVLNNIINVANGTYTTKAKLKVTSVTSGKINTVSVYNNGNYSILPSNPVSVSGGNGSGAKFNLNWSVDNIQLTNGGGNYTSVPTVVFTPSGATATATISNYTGTFYSGQTNGNGSNVGPIWNTNTYAPNAHAWLGKNSTDWNTASNWFAGWLPYNNIPVNIGNNATRNCVVSNHVECENLTIESNRTLTVNPGYTLKANGNTSINGQLILDANSSNAGCFIDNGIINYGSNAVVNVKRVLTNNKWHYVSSPVSNASSNTFWGTAIYTYAEEDGNKGTTIAWKPVTNNITLEPMKGYDLYVKNTDKTITFTGQLNTGVYSNTSLTRNYDGYNFIGNPYPSAIDWDAASGWTKTNLDNTIYLWDPNANNGAGNYTAYCNGNSTNGGSNIIAPTQAFWVKVQNNKNSGSVSMDNNVRVSSNTAYRKANNSIKITCTTEGFSDESVISFNENATEKFDNQYDASKFFVLSGSGSMIYTKTDDEMMSINCIPELKATKSIILYSKVLANNQMTLKFSGLDCVDEAYRILLEDTKTGEFHEVRSGNYNYLAEMNDNEARFILHFIAPQVINAQSNYNALASLENENTDETLIYSFNNSIYVNIETLKVEKGSSVSVFNVQGKELLNSDLTYGLNKLELSAYKGIVIVQVNLNNNISSEKFILN